MTMMMKKTFIKLFTLTLFSALVCSCSTSKQVAALRPSPDYSSATVVYDKQLSFINMPVSLAISDIQSQTNKYLNGLIYEDKNLDDDNLMINVYKESPILITEQNGKIVMDLPLKIIGKAKYGINQFGISLSDTKDFYLNGTIRLHSIVGLKDWKLTTNTTIQDIKWKESPTISIAGKAISVTYLINPALNLFKGKLALLVDNAIAKSVDFKPQVLDALQAFSTPKKVNEEYETWFVMQPVEVYASKTTVANQKININLGLKTYLETAIGRKPSLVFDRNAIVLKTVDNMPNDFKANLAAFATYSYASQMMQKNFAGQKFESGKRAVTVNKVELWGKEGKMIVALNLSGSVNGDFYLSGFPVYDAQKKEIYLDKVDFVLDSKSKLLKIGDWLAHDIVLNKITDACRFSIADQLSLGAQTMATYLNNYQPIKGVVVNGTLGQITPNKVILTPNAIVAYVNTTGKVAVTINGLQ